MKIETVDVLDTLQMGDVALVRSPLGRTCQILVANSGPDKYVYISLEDGNRVSNEGSLASLAERFPLIGRYNAKLTLEKRGWA